MTVETLIIDPIVSEDELDKISNTFVDYDPDKFRLIEKDTDIYTEYDGELQCVLRFRKNVIPKDMCDILWSSLKTAAPLQRGRAEATGMKKSERYSNIKSKSSGKNIHQMNSKARSGIIGYYDNKSFMGHKYTKGGSMCRLTAFSRKNLEKYKQVLPIISHFDNLYKNLGGKYYENQINAIQTLDPNFRIENTAYTTVTVNRNFRTALHKDKGDYKKGMINLAVTGDGCDYSGCYTMLPKYGIAVNCRPSDFLIFDTHEYHCNSEKIGKGERLSLVLYLRELMLSTCPKHSDTET